MVPHSRGRSRRALKLCVQLSLLLIFDKCIVQSVRLRSLWHKYETLLLCQPGSLCKFTPSPLPNPTLLHNPTPQPIPNTNIYTNPPLYRHPPLESFGKEMDKPEKNEKESKRLTGQQGPRVTRIDQRRMCYIKV